MKIFEEIVYSNVNKPLLSPDAAYPLCPVKKENNCGFLKFFNNSGPLKLGQYLKIKDLIKSANFHVYP